MARPSKYLLSYLRNLIVSLAGLVCGVLTGLTVAAGSVVSTPLVRYLLGLRPARASATALATTFFAALTAITTYAQIHKVSWGVGILLAFTQIFGVSFAERRASALRGTLALRMLWAVIGIAAGIAMVAWNVKIDALSTTRLAFPFVHSMLGLTVWVIVVGLGIGAISQIMDLGGVLIIPACLLLLRLDPLMAQGTALVGLMIVSLSGLLIYTRTGEVELGSAVWMSLGGLFGGLVGAYFAVRLLAPAMLVSVFGIVLTLVAFARFLGASQKERSVETG
jgi:hypothetical protein